MIEVGPHFWNIRGNFKIAGLLNVGTQCSLVQRGNGRFLLLDSYTLDEETAEQVDAYTDGGQAIEAVLNLHPFHTVHVASVHERYPGAALYGSRRHREKFPDLPWKEDDVTDPELHERFAEDLRFSVPHGVDFISSNERVHFSSVLAYHPASRTVHVDDTYNYIPRRGLLGLTPLAGEVSFHPTLAKALEPRAGAAAEFRAWAEALTEEWGAAENLCAAHTGALLAAENDGPDLSEQLAAALDKVQDTLASHEAEHG